MDSREEMVVRAAVELESMQEGEGLFQTQALKEASVTIQGWRPLFLLFQP